MSVKANTMAESGMNLRATEVNPGMVFQTPSGERVEIASDDGPANLPLVLRFPDREPQLDEDGEKREHHVQYRSRYAVADTVNQEGWELVSNESVDDQPEKMDGEFDGPVPCPVCGQYMSTFYDGQGMPTALCTRTGCSGERSASELIDAGRFYKSQ